jgi:predicted MFS family arabinose efflux permease
MPDFSEFRTHWRPMLGAFLGMGSALSLNSYILSIFAPYLIDDFGWSRSQWAMLGTVQMLVMVCLPIAGRLTDKFGVRRVAAVGALSFPVFLVLIATMDGSIGTYAAIYVAQTIICSTTTATVYSRVVAAAFKIRRGLALGIAGSSPPLIAALFSSPISSFVAEHGWRAGYLTVAAFCAVCAVLTLALLPKHQEVGSSGTESAQTRPVGAYRAIFAMPAFWIMLAAFFLVNLPFTLATSQIKLVVLAQGLPDSTAAVMVSVFAVSSIVGRIISGGALDYVAAHLIAALNFVLPFIGLLLLASAFDSMPAVALAIGLIGFAFGGEGDILPYLVMRHFGITVFSTVVGMLSAAIGLVMGLGNLLLAYTLGATDSFAVYLYTAAATALIGSGLFLTLGLPKVAGRRLEVAAA